MGRDRRRCAWLQPGTAARLKAGLPKAPHGVLQPVLGALTFAADAHGFCNDPRANLSVAAVSACRRDACSASNFTGSPSVAAVAARGSSSPPSPRIAAPAPYRQRGAQFPPGGRKAPIPQPLPRSLPLSQSLLLPQQMHGDSQCFIPLHSLWNID